MSIMFVRVSTPEGCTSITVEDLARAMAEPHVWNESGKLYKVDEIMTTLHKIAQAGLISDEYLVDFVEVATRMRKYVRANTKHEIERQLGMDSKYAETERKPLKPRRPKEVYHGEEPRYAS